MSVKVINGDCIEVIKTMPANSIDCCVTSPPYFCLRNYNIEGQIGLEETPKAYVDKMVQLFREVRRVLKDEGTLWLNLGDSYVSKPTGSLGNHTGKDFGFTGGHKHQEAASKRPDKTGFGLCEKNLIGIPWLVAFALQSDGWILRQDIIWEKKNPMPESVKDRCTKAHEYIFLFSKQQKYYFDSSAIQEETNDGKTRNKRDVWSISSKPYKGAHFATFPPDLITPCILAGCPKDGIVLDPFGGSGTTGEVSEELGRNSILIELNPEYIALINDRIDKVQANEKMQTYFGE